MTTIVTRTPVACWRLARQAANAYQRKLTRAEARGQWTEAARCRIARDTASRIALLIRFGRGYRRRRA